jgi:hypothetical protein
MIVRAICYLAKKELFVSRMISARMRKRRRSPMKEATAVELLLPNGQVQLSGSTARWYVFKPKIPIWVNFGGPCNGRCWYFL